MEEYFQEVKMYQNATTWGSKAICLLWTFLFNIWEGRNKQLHNTNRIKDMQGFQILLKSIKKEWQVGLGRLPTHQFDIYFRGSLKSILSQNEEGLKHWLVTVQLG